METTFQTIGHGKAAPSIGERRKGHRRQMTVPGRIIWRDNRGTPRFSSIVTRDVSEQGALVECLSGPPIPMHRLVFLQLDRGMRNFEFLPPAVKQGKVLSAVYRVGPTSKLTGLPDAYALRLLVEPGREACTTSITEPSAGDRLALLA